MKDKLKISAIISIVLLIIWEIICSEIGSIGSTRLIINNIFLYSAILALSVFIFLMKDGKGRLFITALLSLFALFEVGHGILQLAGIVKSSNENFKLCGIFLNPGPYGGFMAVAASLCLASLISGKQDESDCKWMKSFRCLFTVTLICTVIMDIVSLSRASWTGFLASAAVMLYGKFRDRLKPYRLLVIVSVSVLAAVAATGIYFIKPQSALARLHIWHMDCLAISEHPITGVGAGAEMGAYGKAQTHYYQIKDRTLKIKQLADSCDYPFNEFLKRGMTSGIPGLALTLILVISITMTLYRKRSPWFFALMTLTIFSCFSYSTNNIPFMSVFTICLADTIVDGIRQMKTTGVRTAMIALCAISSIAFAITCDEKTHMDKLMNDWQLLYDTGTDLCDKGKYSEAIKLLERGCQVSANPAFYIFLAICHINTGEYDKAIDETFTASDMVPMRLMPLYVRMLAYVKKGDFINAHLVRQEALSMPADLTKDFTAQIRKQIEDFGI